MQFLMTYGLAALPAPPTEFTLDTEMVVDLSLLAECAPEGVIGTVPLGHCPPCVLVCSDGTLLVSSGFGPVKRMRQNERQLSNAGVPAPKTFPVIKSSADQGGGAGAPVATRTLHFDYSQYGRVKAVWAGSAVSTLATELLSGRASLRARQTDLAKYLRQAVPLTGEAEYAKVRRLTSLFVGNTMTGPALSPRWEWNHLAFDLQVYDESELNDNPGVGTITGRYQAWLRYVDRDGIPGDPSPVSPDALLVAEPYVQYDAVEVPDDPRVARRQLWRNDNGQADVFWLDVDTADLTSTTFRSHQSDAQLRLSLDLPFEDEDDFSLVYLYAEPPTDKPFLAEHKSRVWYGGTVLYDRGHAEVTNGSATVRGVGTAWTPAMLGRQFVAGGVEYLVLSVVAATQVMTIDPAYSGATDALAAYAVRSYRGETYEIYCSGAGFPESLPADNRFTLPMDNDEQTGFVSFNEDVWLLKKRHIYRISHGADPKRDAAIQLAAQRGCLSYRCAVTVGGACYMIDRQGIHVFQGGPAPGNASLPVADIFRIESAWRKINWKADPCVCHAVHVEEHGFIRFFVPMGTDTQPHNAICHDHRRERFWIEEYPVAITASCVSSHGDLLGRPLLGAEDGELLTSDLGPLDFAPSTAGTRLAVVSVPSRYRVTTSGAVSADFVGMPVAVVEGRGRGQRRRVVAVDGDDVVLDAPLLRTPDATSVLQVGAVPYEVVTKEYSLVRSEQNASQALMLAFQPSAADLKVYADVRLDRDGYAANGAPQTVGAVAYPDKLDEPTAKRVDLTNRAGYARVNFDRAQENDAANFSTAQVELEGFSGEARPVIKEVTVVGAL